MKMQTNRIRLMPIEPAHYWQVYQWQHSGDYEEFFGDAPLMSFEQVAELRKNRIIFMIVDSSRPKNVYGMLSFFIVDEKNRNAHFGIMIDSKFHKLGLATESVRLAFYYFLNCLNFYKIIMRIAEDNIASKSLASAFNCEVEGILKHEIYHDGEFKNVIRYQITKGPFNKAFKKDIEESQRSLSQPIKAA